jgi:undecaprenyl-diphosphatase
MTKPSAIIIILLLGAMLAASTSAQPESVFSKKYASIVAHDFTRITFAPAFWHKKDWLRFGVATSAIGLSMAVLDKPMETLIQRNRNHATDLFAKRVEPFGRHYPSALIIGWYGAGLVFKDSTAKTAALDAASATTIASAVISPLLKELFGRRRPWENQGSHQFEPFSSAESFPSGHAMRVFTLASVMASHYRRTWVTVTCYTLAGLVAWSRMEYDVHYFSDVLAGAAIGTSIGLGVTKLNRKLRLRR